MKVLRGLTVCLVLAFAPGTALAHGPLGGPAFTDPSTVQEMPANWKSRPIQYAPAAGEADIVVTLDQHLYPALVPVIEKYAEKMGLRVVVSEGTCGISAGKLTDKAVDIGGFCCPPGETDRLPGLVFHTIGIAALALLVHPDNPIEDVTLADARRLFQGEICRWSKTKDRTTGRTGKDLPLQPIGRLHCKLRPGHWRLLLDNEDLFSRDLQEVGTIPDMIYLVSASPGAIGYEVIWNVLRYRGKVKALRIDGFDPNDPQHLISLDYPLYRTYNITTWQGRDVENPHAQKLVEHLLREAERLSPECGIIPASRLRPAGWKFRGNELTGGPR